MGFDVKMHLGVLDEPYSEEGGITTGDVAEILESKYGVMQHFANLHEETIAELVEISATEAIEMLMKGAPIKGIQPLQKAFDDIEDVFRTYLNDEEIVDTGQEGVPTAAALAGVRTSLKKRKELKRPRKRVRERRPSFVDTGLYRRSFKVWTE